MRRVYYTWGIHLATHTVTKHVVVLGVLGYALKELVHVAAIYKSAAALETGQLLSWTTSMFLNADWLTLAVLGLAIFTALSLRIRVRSLQLPALQVA